jgi:hypothetical protein
LEKAVSRQARKERKGKSGSYLMNSFADLAPLREQMPF